MTSKWYRKGLSFECTGCGKCCTGSPGYVWVSLKEIEQIASFLELTVEEFSSKYLRKIGNRYSLIEKNQQQYDCIFLEGNQCQIYDHRPRQCKTYPFWPTLLASEKTWREEAKFCEGLKPSAKKWTQHEIDEIAFKRSEEQE